MLRKGKHHGAHSSLGHEVQRRQRYGNWTRDIGVLDQVATSLDSDPQALDSHGVSLCRDAVRMGLRHDGRLDGGRKGQKPPRNAMLVGSVLYELDSLAVGLAGFRAHLV